jgi:hypothetical protein
MAKSAISNANNGVRERPNLTEDIEAAIAASSEIGSH